jgi:hypothetical protein
MKEGEKRERPADGGTVKIKATRQGRGGVRNSARVVASSATRALPAQPLIAGEIELEPHI